MRPVRFLLGIAAATGVGIGFASPAYAAELELTESHKRVLAREFARQSCAQGTPQTDPRMGGRGVHEDGWHLRASGGDLVRLTITSAPAGSLLVTASAEVERGTRLIIQAACAGTPEQPTEPTPSPTATATSTATATPAPATPGPTPTPPAGTPAPAGSAVPTVSPAPTGSAVPAPAGEDSSPRDEDLPGLAFTGAQVGGMVVLGSGLLSAGVALVAVRRRRILPDLLDGAAD